MLKDLWQYNDTTNTWHQKNNFNGAKRKSASVFVLGNKAFIVNGDKNELTNGCWQYNAIADSFIQKTDFTGTPRSGCVAFTLNGKGIVGLGYDTLNHFCNDFMQYDTLSDSWSPFDSFPAAARSGAIAFSFPTRAYVALGYDSLFLKDVYYYSALNDEANSLNADEKIISIYPNPVAENFSVSYSLPVTQKYFYSLYNFNGEDLIHNPLDATKHLLEINTNLLNNGIYFFRIETEYSSIPCGKVVVLK